MRAPIGEKVLRNFAAGAAADVKAGHLGVNKVTGGSLTYFVPVTVAVPLAGTKSISGDAKPHRGTQQAKDAGRTLNGKTPRDNALISEELS